jgi:hypothetical protein
VGLLGLLDGSDLAGTDSPNGFVGNDNIPAELVPDGNGVLVTHFQAASGISPAIAFNCLSTTSLV